MYLTPVRPLRQLGAVLETRLTLSLNESSTRSCSASVGLITRSGLTCSYPAQGIPEGECRWFLSTRVLARRDVAFELFVVDNRQSRNSSESFSPGLLTTLGKAGLGYDVCWVSPPPSMMNDIQDNAEYIVYAMSLLFSKAGPLPISGWSQGNLATQWALTFYPSMRAKTRTFISLAGDFRYDLPVVGSSF